MKQIISAILVCVLLVGAMLALVSCTGGIDNGTYVSSKGDTIEIDGKKYVVSTTIDGEALKLTYSYEIKDAENDPDKQTITLTYESTDYNGANSSIKDGLASVEPFTCSYETFEGGFVIDGVKFTKK